MKKNLSLVERIFGEKIKNICDLTVADIIQLTRGEFLSFDHIPFEDIAKSVVEEYGPPPDLVGPVEASLLEAENMCPNADEHLLLRIALGLISTNDNVPRDSKETISEMIASYLKKKSENGVPE